MTGVERTELRVIQPDLRALRDAVDTWASERGYKWDPFCAHVAVPAWEEERYQHSALEILETNERSLAVSDALIVHAFGDGSAMLGWIISSVLRRAHVVPVLVVAHENEPLSKAFIGLTHRYEALTFETFPDDFGLLEVTQTWLSRVGARVEEGPLRRKALETIWLRTANALRERWSRATTAMRRTVVHSTGFTEEWISELLTEPLLVADLPAHTAGILIEILGVDVAPARLLASAREAFDDAELAAWRYWSKGKSLAYTTTILEAAMKDRTDGRVGRERQYFGQTGAWDAFAARWRTA